MYYLLKLLSISIQVLPLRVALGLGRLLGRAVFLLSRRKGNADAPLINVRFHIETMLGDEMTPEEIERVAKKTLENMGMNLVEFFRLPRLNESNVDRYVKFEGLQILDEHLRRGTGIFMLTGHFGNWEFCGAALGVKGYKLSSIVEQTPELRKGGNRFVNSLRRSKGIGIIYKPLDSLKTKEAERGRIKAVKEAINRIRNNEMITLLADQDGGEAGTLVEFFGHEVSFPKGPAVLPRKTGVPLIPMFFRREPGGRHRVIIKPPVRIERTRNPERDLEVNLKRIVAEYEREIRENPAEWLRWCWRRMYRSVNLVVFLLALSFAR